MARGRVNVGGLSIASLKIKQDISIAKTPLPFANTSQGAVNLSDKVYTFGGESEATITRMYDPLTDTWSTKATNTSPRRRHGVAAVNNKAYLIGGWDNSGVTVTLNQEYDPVSNTFSTKAAITTNKRWFACLESLGKIYCIGGVTNSGTYDTSNYQYDPATNTWSTKAYMPSGSQRCNFGAGKVADDIVISGGIASGSFAIAISYKYNITSNTWVQVADMPYAIAGFTVQSVGGEVYFLGGTVYSQTVRLQSVLAYIVSTNKWEIRRGLLSGRENLTSALVADKIYSFGGVGGSFANPLGSVNTTFHEMYDPKIEIYK